MKKKKVSKSALSQIFPSSVPEQLVDKFFNIFDSNKDGMIDVREFICGLSTLCRGSEEEKLEFDFRLFDSDGDGRLSRDEISSMVRSIWRIEDINKAYQNFEGLREKEEKEGGKEDKEKENEEKEKEKEKEREREKEKEGGGQGERLERDLEETSLNRVIDTILAEFQKEEGGDYITMNEFKTWVRRNPIAVQFFETIRRISNVSFGVRPSCPTEEKEIVSDLGKQKLMRVGDLYYVISYSWWQLWKEYTHYDDNTNGFEEEKAKEVVENESTPLSTSIHLGEPSPSPSSPLPSSSSSSSSSLTSSLPSSSCLLYTSPSPRD
eukprot:TRINITY_DN1757_c0_g2_i1.p1 TRINITY_DN1757_c0_g2~~TRINITY_DN1757_c0_g2_i1.p1  ORF type:complete len:322 (-),score=143.72 TRINITY_DN1757_c0_g2_i1:31-996(-)